MADLADNPQAFDFFRAVRLVENQHRQLPRIGRSRSLKEDPVRFGQPPSLAFAPATISGYRAGDAEHPPKLLVNFFGLLGPNGPLPLHLTEYARDRQLNAGDATLVGFLDVFHHRLLSLFYRAWACNQKAVDLDRPDQQRFGLYIGSLFGIGMKSLVQRDEIEDWAKLYYAGRLVSQTRNAEGLQAIVQDYFRVPTAVETFAGRWLALPADSLCQLGATPATGQLGVTVIVGSHVWDCQLSFRLRLGPMALADLERLLPDGSSFARLRAWVLNYVNTEFFFDIQLVLRAAAVPETRLGQYGRLGWTTWLKTKPFARDADDLVLVPH